MSVFNRKSAIGNRRSRRGFSLVELLVVVGIIALLVSVLIPTIRKIRIAGQTADTQSLLNQLDAAITNYYQEFRAYPGPLPNAFIVVPTNQGAAVPPAMPIYDGSATGSVFNDGTIGVTAGPATNNLSGSRVTAAENLLLGLCGGLALDLPTGNYYFDKNAVGQGPVGFNRLRPGRSTPFMQKVSVSEGRLKNAVYTNATDELANDSIIPEFLDKYSAPMPFLYLRSRQSGAEPTLVTQSPAVGTADYDINDILPYTNGSIGGDFGVAEREYVGVTYNNMTPHGLRSATANRSINKTVASALGTYQYPYDAYDYLVDPTSYDRTKTSALTPAEAAAKRSRKKDSYVLISAGRDRIYGTADDITNFGSVQP